MTDEEFEKLAREAAEENSAIIGPAEFGSSMITLLTDTAIKNYVSGAKWARGQTVDEAERDSLKAENERLKAQWAEERKWIIQAKDDAIDEANVVTLLAESYRAILLKFIKFYNEDYDPTIGNMPLDIYEQAHLALKDGGET